MLTTVEELLKDKPAKPLTEEQVVNEIKMREVETARLGQYFLVERDGVMSSGRMTIVNGMLILDGKETVDMRKAKVFAADA